MFRYFCSGIAIIVLNVAWGALNLCKYLQYAEQGPSALAISSASEGEPESPLEAEVAKEIRKLGYTVTSQVGCSGYRIDLGVLDPAKPGRFILGVECDGQRKLNSLRASFRLNLKES